MNEPIDGVSWVVFAISTLASGLAGALLSTIVYVWRENRQFKIATLKTFAANRYDLKGEEFSRALNEILVVFNDDKVVMTRLQEFHTAIYTKTGNAEDALIRLYKAMCNATGVDVSHFNDSFFLVPFNTKSTSAVLAVGSAGAGHVSPPRP